jgi:hypothetical protein
MKNSIPSIFKESSDDEAKSQQGPADMETTVRKTKPRIVLTAVVKGKEGDISWKENAEVTSVSSSGAGFFIQRECSVGRLVSLMLPMPSHLRSYDRDKKLYRIWGLVQYCYESGGEDGPGFHAGVAFVGKDAPYSYQRNPEQSYRVCGMGKSGLWRVEELESNFKKRRSTRYWNTIDASLFLLDDELNSVADEKTVTENISESGASVFSSLRVDVGDRVKFLCQSPPFSSLSIVRNRRIGADDRTRVHLEFVEDFFPILEIDAPIEEEGEH